MFMAVQSVNSIAKIPWAFAVINVGTSIKNVVDDTNRGVPAVSAIGREVAVSALYQAFPQIGIASFAYNAGKMGVEVYHMMKDSKNQAWTNYHNPNLGGGYQDTQPALTMRQRGAEAINQHRVHGRQVLGQEARLMSR